MPKPVRKPHRRTTKPRASLQAPGTFDEKALPPLLQTIVARTHKIDPEDLKMVCATRRNRNLENEGVLLLFAMLTDVEDKHKKKYKDSDAETSKKRKSRGSGYQPWGYARNARAVRIRTDANSADMEMDDRAPTSSVRPPCCRLAGLRYVARI